MPIAKVNSIDLYYEVHGSGPALMLIAGLGSDSQSWFPVMDELKKHFTLILPDNRGCGRTTPHDVDLSIQSMSDDCMSLLSELGVECAILLGHSMGGYIAQDCAIRYPQRVSKLILESTFPFSPARNNRLLNDFKDYLQSGMDLSQWFRGFFYWLYSADFFEDSKRVNDAVQMAVDYPFPQSCAGFNNQVKAITEFNCRDRLTEITQKTLILHGSDDLLFPAEESARLFQAIPDVSVSIVEKAAHSLHMEYPEEFVGCVLKYLKTY